MNSSRKYYSIKMVTTEGLEPIQIVERCEPDELPDVVEMFAKLRSEGPAQLIITRHIDLSRPT